MFKWIGSKFWIFSLIVAVALSMLWIGSYGRGCTLRWTRSRFSDDRELTWTLILGRGIVGISYTRTVYRPEMEAQDATASAQTFHSTYARMATTRPVQTADLFPGSAALPQQMGFGFKHSDDSPVLPGLPNSRKTFDLVVIPYWFAVMAAAILPALRVWTGLRKLSRRRRRLEKGLCLKCGYDLRFSEGRCPECGAPIPVKTAPPSAS